MELQADLHTHTIASSHAFSTVKEMASAAAAAGLQLLGITDHGVNMPGAPHEYYFSQLLTLPDEIEGIHI